MSKYRIQQIIQVYIKIFQGIICLHNFSLQIGVLPDPLSVFHHPNNFKIFSSFLVKCCLQDNSKIPFFLNLQLINFISDYID